MTSTGAISGRSLTGAPRLAKLIVFGFLAVIPFLYAMQVVLWRNDFVPLVYAALATVFGVVLWMETRGELVAVDGRALFFDEVLGFFVLMNLGWVGFEVATNGPIAGVRTFIYFVLPPLLAFFIPRYMSAVDDRLIIRLGAMSAMLVSAELIWERWMNLFLFQPSPFQERNFAYVATVGTGVELQQLLDPGYRAPGLMEHLHATGTFISVGVLLWFFLALERRTAGRILGLLLCSFALVLSGARTALLAAVFGGMAAMAVGLVSGEKGPRQVVRYLVAGSVLLGLALALGLSYEPLRRIYLPLLTATTADGSFFLKVIPTEIGLWLDTVREVPLSALFGLGPGSESWRNELGASSDDFFVVDLLARYGVIGTALFYGLLAVYFREMLASLRLEGAEEPWGDRSVLILCFGVCALLLITTVHSGALVRKGVYPWLFVALGMGRRRFPGVFGAAITSHRQRL